MIFVKCFWNLTLNKARLFRSGSGKFFEMHKIREVDFASSRAVMAISYHLNTKCMR